MEDDHNKQGQTNSTRRDDIDDQIDSLTPVPSDVDEPRADDVTDELDALIPEPVDESIVSDDATTHEEMEVDATNDDVDDIIPVSSGNNDLDDAGSADLSYLDDAITEEPEIDIPSEEDMQIGGEHVTWEAVEDQPMAIDPDNEPINQDSGFYSSSYASAASTQQANSTDSSAEVIADDSTVDDANASESTPLQGGSQSDEGIARQCPACGTAVGNAPYCPQCGTDQFPSSNLSTILQPLLSWSRPLAIRSVLLVGALLILLSLLSDSGTSALIIAAITMPIVLLVRISMQLSSHTRTGWFHMGLMAFVGFAIGLPLSWFSGRLVRDQWFDTGVLNFGAAGFGGNFAEAAGVAPFFVWLVAGLLIPVVLVLVIGAIPVALRMVMNLPPKESSGMMLSGATAAGYVAASSIIFYSPLYDQLMPRMTTSQWTLTIFGLAVIRPLVWVFGGAMIGTVVWRYLRTASPASIMMPGIIAGVLVIGFSILSLAAGPAGHWVETVVGLIFAVAAVFFYHRFLKTAIRNDDAIKTK